MNSFAIRIQMNNSYIGCMLIKRQIEPLEAFKQIESIISNYNKNLASVKCPKLVLGHRILDEENLDCNLSTGHTRIDTISYGVLKENFPDYNWPKMDDYIKANFAKMYFTKESMESSFLNAESTCVIDLDTSSIYLNRFFMTCTRPTYAKNNGFDVADIETRLNMVEFNPCFFSINNLGELMEVYNNGMSFLSEKTGWVFSPIKD